jgi:hypothetical protein
MLLRKVDEDVWLSLLLCVFASSLSSVFVQFLYPLRRRIGDNPLVPDFSKEYI